MLQAQLTVLKCLRIVHAFERAHVANDLCTLKKQAVGIRVNRSISFEKLHGSACLKVP